MTNDLATTLLIALSVEINDHVIPPGSRGRGRPKQLADAELICLAVAQVLLGARSEHHWLGMCYGTGSGCATDGWASCSCTWSCPGHRGAARGYRHVSAQGPGWADDRPLRRGQVQVLLARPDRKDEPRWFGNLGGMRQWIEAVYDALKDQLTLERHGDSTRPKSSPASPSSCWSWPPESGATGPSRLNP